VVSDNLFFRKYTYINILFFIVAYSSSTLILAGTKTIQQHCIVTVDSIIKPQSFIYVDVRNELIFNKVHISNSINIPLSLIKTKTFLKNKTTILVGNGWNEQSLIDECISLKNNGFKSVKVLAGGIVSLFAKGNNGVRFEFINNKSSQTPLLLISLTSKEFFNNKLEKKFVPLVISNSTKKQITATLPHAKIYSLITTKKQLLNGLKRLGKGSNPIVIFSDNNTIVDAAINDYLRKPLRKIYFFEGGFNTYYMVNNLNKMTAVSNQHKRLSTKKPVSCAN